MVKIGAAVHCLLYLSFALLVLGDDELLGVGPKQFSRYDFPPGFVFGSGTSAYQVEGAAFEDGRKTSIFDTFLHAGRLAGNGDVACDEYHKYKEDVQLMVNTGLDAYRFSISWSRLIPDGTGPVNPKGLEYYNNLINELINHGIKPHVTLVHMDIPQVLEDNYGGFVSRNIIEDLTAFADVCFREFGDRVKHWTTVNEANIFSMGGYDLGNTPPSRCSRHFGSYCIKGNSSTEPYLAAHNILLSHASIVRLYKQKYQGKQLGLIGLGLYVSNFIPATKAKEDVTATQRCYDSFIGWFMHPLTYGDYPEIMKRNVGTRIPKFTKNESKMVKGAFDFIGINYYTVYLVKDNSKVTPIDYFTDMRVQWFFYNSSSSAGPPGGTIPNTPWGLQGVLEYFKNAYNNPPIYILENGQVTDYNIAVNDPSRVEYLQAHISVLLDSVRNGSNTKGYMVWSFLDVIEMFGKKRSFGLYYVDTDDPHLTRYPKLSQQWYSGFLKGENVSTEYDEDNYQSENVATILKSFLVDMDEHNWVGQSYSDKLAWHT